MKVIITAVCCLAFNFLMAQSNLPLKELQGNKKLPFILYLSGDGGLNKFSTELCKSLNAKGYEIACVDSRSYFWKKKTPQQAAGDISAYLTKKITSRNNQKFIFMGYSFGAEILPFVINRFPETLKQNLISSISLDISTHTDFEIHLSEILGGSSKSGLNVLDEVNKMGNVKFSIIQNADESDFPMKNVKIKNFKSFSLEGNHHFDGNVSNVASLIIRCF